MIGMQWRWLKTQRSKVGKVRVGINAFRLFEPVDNAVRCRGEERFHKDFKDVIRQRQRPEQLTREDSGQSGDGDKDNAVGKFANDGAGDRARPEVFSLGERFHDCHDNGIGKTAKQVTENAGKDNPAEADTAQNGVKGVLTDCFLPGGFTGEQADEEEHQKTENEGSKAEPDDPARAGITVDFRQDVPKDVGEGEKHGTGIKSHAHFAQRKAPVDDLGRRREVRQDQNDCKTDRNEVEVSKCLTLFFLFHVNSPLVTHRVILQNDETRSSGFEIE